VLKNFSSPFFWSVQFNEHDWEVSNDQKWRVMIKKWWGNLLHCMFGLGLLPLYSLIFFRYRMKLANLSEKMDLQQHQRNVFLSNINEYERLTLY
jgi:hypothetical protein